MAYTMATNRHITPKPGQGWRVRAEWWTLASWPPAWVGQNPVTGFWPRVRQRPGDRGQDEQDGDHGGDGGGRVPEQGPRGDAEHRQRGQGQPRSRHRPGDPGG